MATAVNCYTIDYSYYIPYVLYVLYVWVRSMNNLSDWLYTHLFNCENESTSACKPMCSTDFFALTVLLIILYIKPEKIWQV